VGGDSEAGNNLNFFFWIIRGSIKYPHQYKPKPMRFLLKSNNYKTAPKIWGSFDVYA
jgi:hypothetical protein